MLHASLTYMYISPCMLNTRATLRASLLTYTEAMSPIEHRSTNAYFSLLARFLVPVSLWFQQQCDTKMLKEEDVEEVNVRKRYKNFSKSFAGVNFFWVTLMDGL